MPRKYIAFDIETAKLIEGEVGDIKVHRPLGICCAATFASDELYPLTWSGQLPDQTPAPQMSPADLAELVRYLQSKTDAGYEILTWNGLSFDFDILAEESGLIDECRQLARQHVDMMFHIFCEKGFPIGLDAASRAMRLPGKPEGVAGELAPQCWAEGRCDEVLDYVSQDVSNTLKLALACEKSGQLKWITKKGKESSLDLPNAGWLNVEAALNLPVPDTSWMDNPMTRERFMEWL